MMLQSTMFKKQRIDLSSAVWTMHEFFAGSGLVAYGLKGMFAPVMMRTLGVIILNSMISRMSMAMTCRMLICHGPVFLVRICL